MPLHAIHLCLIIAADPPLRAAASGPDLTRYLTVCVILLLAIGGVAWLFKRTLAGAIRARAAQRSLQIVDMLPLGGKQRVCVVRCYDRTFALGLGDKEVSLIAELDALIAPRAAEPAPADRVSFRDVLERLKPASPAGVRRDAAQPLAGGLRSGGILG